MLLFPEVLVIHKGIARNNGVFAVQAPEWVRPPSGAEPSIHESLWRSFVDGSPAGPGTEFFLTITTTSITSTTTSTTTSISTITGRVYVKAWVA